VVTCIRSLHKEPNNISISRTDWAIEARINNESLRHTAGQHVLSCCEADLCLWNNAYPVGFAPKQVVPDIAGLRCAFLSFRALAVSSHSTLSVCLETLFYAASCPWKPEKIAHRTTDIYPLRWNVWESGIVDDRTHSEIQIETMHSETLAPIIVASLQHKAGWDRVADDVQCMSPSRRTTLFVWKNTTPIL